MAVSRTKTHLNQMGLSYVAIVSLGREKEANPIVCGGERLRMWIESEGFEEGVRIIWNED